MEGDALKWIPSWLAERYSLIYIVKGVKAFDFDEAKRLLRIEDKRKVSIVLSQLRNRGFLISWRDSIDPRRKFFRLILPVSIISIKKINEDFGPNNEANSIFLKVYDGIKHATKKWSEENKDKLGETLELAPKTLIF